MWRNGRCEERNVDKGKHERKKERKTEQHRLKKLGYYAKSALIHTHTKHGCSVCERCGVRENRIKKQTHTEVLMFLCVKTSGLCRGSWVNKKQT